MVLKSLPTNAREIRASSLIPGSGRSLGGVGWQPTPVFLPGESHGQRSLAGYSPERPTVEHYRTDSMHMCMHTTFHLHVKNSLEGKLL